MRYPISIQTFEQIIEGKYAYVDKTALVYDLAQEHVCFLSRPRRFGKSLLISTLDAYFSGRKELFAGLLIDRLESKWDKYPIFRIDFSKGNFENTNELANLLNSMLEDWEEQYGSKPGKIAIGDRFQYVLEQAALQTGKRAVVLIDEYDKPLLDVLGTPQESINRNILKGFFGTFKAADASLRFVLLTGVTKFSQISVFSGFNQPNDISMNPHFDTICGITGQELHSVFAEPIRKLAKQFGCTEDEMKADLKKQYDGYHFSSALHDVYNPFSIINVFNNGELSDYWYRSGTPTYLARLIEGHNVNMQRLLNESYAPANFMDYRADAEDPLAMFYQSGYITIKQVEREGRLQFYKLDYPNDEVRRGFVNLIGCGYFSEMNEEPDCWILKLSRMYRKCNLDGVRDAFKSFLASIPYVANKDVRALDFETHFQYTFYILNRLLSCYTTLIEKQNSCGRSDIIIESDNDIFIIEFKLDGTADEALQQIEDRQYALPYLQDLRHIHKIGTVISSTTRTIEEWKVID